jgi:hypothetical protein
MKQNNIVGKVNIELSAASGIEFEEQYLSQVTHLRNAQFSMLAVADIARLDTFVSPLRGCVKNE